MIQKKLFFILVTTLMCLTNTTNAQCSNKFKAKNLYQLLYKANKYTSIIKGDSFKHKKRKKSILKKNDSDRKRLLSNDSCQMIFLADTIKVLGYSPRRGPIFRGGINEMIIGNGVCFNYATRPEWPECKNFVKKTMDRILVGNYKVATYERRFSDHMVPKFYYYIITRQEGNIFSVQTFHFVWLETPELDLGERELFSVTNWGEGE